MMSAKGESDIESFLKRFLAKPVSTPLDESIAVELLKHISGCEDCARSLEQQPVHAEAIVEAGRPRTPPDPDSEREVRADQLEVLETAKQVYSELDAEMRASMD